MMDILFKCPACDNYFTTEGGAKMHILENHAMEEPPILCHILENDFDASNSELHQMENLALPPLSLASGDFFPNLEFETLEEAANEPADQQQNYVLTSTADPMFSTPICSNNADDKAGYAVDKCE